MKKFTSIILALFLLAACSADEKSSESKDEKNKSEIIQEETQKKSSESANSEKVESNGEELIVPSENQANLAPTVSGNTDSDQKKALEEFNEELQIKEDNQLEEEIVKRDAILDAEYSIIETLGIAKAIITVNENVKLEEAKKIAKEQSTIIEQKYTDYLPVVVILQNEKQIYSTLDEE